MIHDGKQYTDEEWAQIEHATNMAEHFAMLQLVKKITL
jgi:hypothetical protein